MARTVDWLALEIAYRADMKSLRKLADEYGISESTIRTKAKQCGWTRDGSAIKREHVNALFTARSVHLDDESAETLAAILADAAQADSQDMQLGLSNARLILTITHQVLSAIQQDQQTKHLFMSDARNLKMLSEATRHSIDVIRQIRQLDAPVQTSNSLSLDDKAILERYVKDQRKT